MLSLSPDGASIAYVTPAEGQGSVLFTVRLGDHPRPVPALAADGKSWRMYRCDWVANTRLACEIYAVKRSPAANMELVTLSRIIALDAAAKTSAC